MSARVAGEVWVGTSWKMTKSLRQSEEYARALAAVDWAQFPGVQPFVIPPATALTTVRNALGEDSRVLLGAQNAHWEDDGAWTGEVSVAQVKDAGAQLVEIGHSERRTWFGESDRTVNLKVRATLRHGLVPLVCVGEPAEVQEQGGSVDHVLVQAHAALEGVEQVDRVLLAYEPVWAIGERGRPAEPDEIAPVVAALDEEWAGRGVGLLYGGSVDRANAADILAVPGLDGLFVGRAAWQVEGFLGLLSIAVGSGTRARA